MLNLPEVALKWNPSSDFVLWNVLHFISDYLPLSAREKLISTCIICQPSEVLMINSVLCSDRTASDITVH